MPDKKKILLVEDESEFRKALHIRLEAAGYDLIEAEDGASGLEMARRHTPDLIILDLMLPKIAGFNVARLLKDDDSLGRIPILMLTARAQSTDKKIGMAVGADAYITKPYKPQELLMTVEQLLDGAEESRGP